MSRELLDRELEQIKLVWVERIEPAKLIASSPTLEVQRVIAEAVERLQIVLFPIIDLGKGFSSVHHATAPAAAFE